MAGWGHRGKQRRSPIRQARRADAALLANGLVGWVTGSVIVLLIALVALLVAGYHAGDVRR